MKKIVKIASILLFSASISTPVLAESISHDSHDAAISHDTNVSKNSRDAHDTNPHPKAAPPSHGNVSHIQETHWDYYGAGAPENWAQLKDEYAVCGSGQFQSPIDLKSTINADLPALNLDYQDVPLTILNNGHTIQVNYPKGSKMTVDGTKFNLLQLHFHTPSEHKINGKTYPMELHFVHATDDGKLGVLGVMIAEGKESATAQKIWNHMPMNKAAAKTYSDVTIDGSSLIPQQLDYFRLTGSLTTPPCSEGVNWHILEDPIEFSKDQIKKFKSVFPLNARPVQPSNSRLIVLDQ